MIDYQWHDFFIFFSQLILPLGFSSSSFPLISQFSVPQRNALNRPEAILSRAVIDLLNYYVPELDDVLFLYEMMHNAQKVDNYTNI